MFQADGDGFLRVVGFSAASAAELGSNINTLSCPYRLVVEHIDHARFGRFDYDFRGCVEVVIGTNVFRLALVFHDVKIQPHPHWLLR